MPSHRSSLLWTVLATLAGIVGAAVAVFQFLGSEQKLAFLAYDDDGFHLLTLAEPVILTGRSYVQKGRWPRTQIMPRNALEAGADERVQPHSRKYLSFDQVAVKSWLSVLLGEPWCGKCEGVLIGDASMPCDTPRETGDLTVGVEFLGKGGSAWAERRLRYCVR